MSSVAAAGHLFWPCVGMAVLPRCEEPLLAAGRGLSGHVGKVTTSGQGAAQGVPRLLRRSHSQGHREGITPRQLGDQTRGHVTAGTMVWQDRQWVTWRARSVNDVTLPASQWPGGQCRRRGTRRGGGLDSRPCGGEGGGKETRRLFRCPHYPPGVQFGAGAEPVIGRG